MIQYAQRRHSCASTSQTAGGSPWPHSCKAAEGGGDSSVQVLSVGPTSSQASMQGRGCGSVRREGIWGRQQSALQQSTCHVTWRALCQRCPRGTYALCVPSGRMVGCILACAFTRAVPSATAPFMWQATSQHHKVAWPLPSAPTNLTYCFGA